MAEKVPSNETGTFSIHNSKSDRDKINSLGWEGIGASTIYSRSLERSSEIVEIGRLYDSFLAGQTTLGQLLKKLNEVRKYK